MDVLAADPNFSAAGTFVPDASGGSPLPCRLVIQRRDPTVRVGHGPGAQAPAWCATIRKSDVPVRPRSGDRLDVTDGPWAGTYRVHRTLEDSFAPAWDLEIGRVA